MATVDQDLVRLHRIARMLSGEIKSPAFLLEELFDFVFLDEHYARNRVLRLSTISEWTAASLNLAAEVIEKIVIHYVRLYQDPHSIPVTHYQKQKRLAIHLDALFAPVLRELVIRTGYETLKDDSGLPVKDSFLDEPILFLKQEARAKGFPKTKKGGGASIAALRERFELKLVSKGARLPLQLLRVRFLREYCTLQSFQHSV